MSIAWPDLLIILIVLGFAVSAVRRGFVAVLLSLVAFVTAFVLSFALYAPLAGFISDNFGVSPVWSRPVAFAAVWLVIETIFSTATRYIMSRLYWASQASQANRALAVLPGALQGLIFAALILTVIAAWYIASSTTTLHGAFTLGKELKELAWP